MPVQPGTNANPVPVQPLYVLRRPTTIVAKKPSPVKPLRLQSAPSVVRPIQIRRHYIIKTAPRAPVRSVPPPSIALVAFRAFKQGDVPGDCFFLPQKHPLLLLQNALKLFQ